MNRFESDWRTKHWNEIHWTWPASKIRNLHERAMLYDMDPFDFYFSELFRGPIEPSGCSAEQGETRQEHDVRVAREDSVLTSRRLAYKSKAIDRAFRAEKALERKRHDIMVLEICDYAVAHGWEPSQLSDLLEPGESLPPSWDPKHDWVAESRS